MARIIDARVQQKADTLDNLQKNNLPLLDGEQVFVRSDVDNQVIGYKVATKGKKFRELPYPDYSARGKVSPTSVWTGRQSGVYIPTKNGTYNGVSVNLADGYQVLYWDGATIEKVVYPSDFSGLVFGGIIDDSFDLSNPTAPIWYIASAGTYNTSPETVLTQDSILAWDGSSWSSKPFDLEVRGEFLVAENMDEMRSITAEVASLLVNGTYKAVELLGYYTPGDTPAAIKYYVSDTTDSDDGGSVIAVGGIKLEHKFNGEVDVRYYGAKEDVGYNNTPLINKVLKLYDVLIDSLYYVSAESNTSGIVVPSNRKIVFTKRGKIKAIASGSDNYQVVRIYNVDNVSIINPVIEGDRDSHTGTGGEWGHGIAILNSTNIYVGSPIVTKCWGDGIYIGNQYWDNVSTKSSEDITIDLPFCDNNRRNGISITSCKGVRVLNPVCTNSNGVAPEAGIDIEPEGADGLPIVLDDITIVNPYTSNNNGSGIMMLISADVTLENNPFINVDILNHIDDGSQFGFAVFGCQDGLRGNFNIVSPSYKNNLNNGVYIEDYGKDDTIDLNITNPKIKNWHTSSSTFEPYKHAISLHKSSVDAYVNTNITIKNPEFESDKNPTEGFPINVSSANPNKTSVFIDSIQKSDTYHKISSIVKGVVLNDPNSVLKGNYWEVTSLQQIVSSGRLLGTYTNKDIIGNPEYNINASGWTDGQKVKFIVESNGYVTIFPPAGSLIPSLVSGNLSSNTIGSYIVLEHRKGKWFIVEEVGEWTATTRTFRNTVISPTEPNYPNAYTVWIDVSSNDIKIRNIDNNGWLPLRIINATKEQAGAVKQALHVPDGSSIDVLLASLRAAGILSSS